jgi:transcription termination factor 2
MWHTRKHHIQAENLLKRLDLQNIQRYLDSKLLRWAGHVARMPKERLPRKFLTSWIGDTPRPLGHPTTSWTTNLVSALTRKEISTNFAEWSTLAQNRSDWTDTLNGKTPRPRTKSKTTSSSSLASGSVAAATTATPAHISAPTHQRITRASVAAAVATREADAAAEAAHLAAWNAAHAAMANTSTGSRRGSLRGRGRYLYGGDNTYDPRTEWGGFVPMTAADRMFDRS